MKPDEISPGQLVPVEEDGRRFEAGVGNGQHRYFAARDLGLPHIPAQQQAVRPLPLVPGWDYAAGPADAGLEAG